ncbi:hypothetical protein [Streptomyces sp. HD]|nr:hypothetical protein [Streptomyces sp. HD]MDC0769961.1 hypothetical protein [Streptomyces sp. HD]
MAHSRTAPQPPTAGGDIRNGRQRAAAGVPGRIDTALVQTAR